MQTSLTVLLSSLGFETIQALSVAFGSLQLVRLLLSDLTTPKAEETLESTFGAIGDYSGS